MKLGDLIFLLDGKPDINNLIIKAITGSKDAVSPFQVWTLTKIKSKNDLIFLIKISTYEINILKGIIWLKFKKHLNYNIYNVIPNPWPI